jgi:hypothetical protein
VTPQNIKDFGSDAAWRLPQARLSHWSFSERLLGLGHNMSPLFGAPGLITSCFKFDWLHAADQGVCADFLGNMFWLFMLKEAGNNLNEKCRNLWHQVAQYYAEFEIQDKLPFLRVSMLRKNQGSPKLRAKAAEARALVAFALRHSRSTLDDSIPIERAAKQAAEHLHCCYENLSSEKFNRASMLEHSKKFLLLYAALESTTPDPFWKIKPKFHIFAELCSSSSNPSFFWTYRDEDFGGYLASSSKRRGGKNTASSMAASVLNRFRAKEEPYLR